MSFAVTEDAISCLAEGVRGLADTWQDSSGYGAGVWGAEVRVALNGRCMHTSCVENGSGRGRCCAAEFDSSLLASASILCLLSLHYSFVRSEGWSSTRLSRRLLGFVSIKESAAGRSTTTLDGRYVYVCRARHRKRPVVRGRPFFFCFGEHEHVALGALFFGSMVRSEG